MSIIALAVVGGLHVAHGNKLLGRTYQDRTNRRPCVRLKEGSITATELAGMIEDEAGMDPLDIIIRRQESGSVS